MIIKNFKSFNEAYASKDDVKRIREQIKPILKKYDLKGTISLKNYTKVVLSVKSEGKLINQFYDDKFSSYNYDRNYREFSNEDHMLYKKYIDRKLEIEKVIEELEKGLILDTYRDNSDSMIDYFDVSYYTEVRIIN